MKSIKLKMREGRFWPRMKFEPIFFQVLWQFFNPKGSLLRQRRTGAAGGRGAWGEFRPPYKFWAKSVRIFSNAHRRTQFRPQCSHSGILRVFNSCFSMKQKIQNHLQSVTKHLYISPLERCNLHCAVCYTRKTSSALTQKQIVAFIGAYQKQYPLETITFCGGEVFVLPYFPGLVNLLCKRHLFIQIITNGTIDRLAEFTYPNLVNMLVSIDGLRGYHDANRGRGNFKKSMALLVKAQKSGFHVGIFSIVTKQNYPDIPRFEQYVAKRLGREMPITYHPRKPMVYLQNHPTSNIKGKIQGFDFLDKEQIVRIMRDKTTFPLKELGCYQIALMSDGNIYGCCEGPVPIGTISDPIKNIVNNLKHNVETWETANRGSRYLGCAYPDFVCGLCDSIANINI